MPDKILIIEGNTESRALLEDLLSAAGYEPLSASNALEGLRLLYNSHPALVLLDIMLPGADGWETCRRIREASDVPIITLTGSIGHTDILRGFELGVEGHLTKPLDPKEVGSRVKGLLERRSHAQGKPALPTQKCLEVNLKTYQVSLNGRNVELPPAQSGLLVEIMRKQNGAVALRELPFHASGPTYVCDEDHISVYMWFLRGRPENDPKDPKSVPTGRGSGHRDSQEPSKSATGRQAR